MKDLRQSQLSQMHREKRALIASGVDRDRWLAKGKAKEFPPGSTHAWARDEVWGPIGSKENSNATGMPLDKERSIDRAPPIARDDSQGDVQGDEYEPQYAHERYSDHQVEGWR